MHTEQYDNKQVNLNYLKTLNIELFKNIQIKRLFNVTNDNKFRN